MILLRMDGIHLRRCLNLDKKIEYEFTDRYQALGIPYPGPGTMCKGQCEGTGYVPIAKNDDGQPWRDLWLKAEEKSPSDDGYHFVVCPDCNGTGNKVKP